MPDAYAKAQEAGMRAVVVDSFGGPEALRVKDLPPPEPGRGQIVVDVAASGVNFLDCYQRSGKYDKPLPFIAGSEGAGDVSAVGSDVREVAVGDRVAWAMVDGGGYAEQVVVPADRVVTVPTGVHLELAAAAMLQGMTAHYLSESTFPARAGQTALVHAAAGGLGLLLTQMLTAKGVRVIGTTSTGEKAAMARAAGAAEIVDYTEDDVAGAVRGLTGDRGVDVVYDGVGRSTFEAGLDSLTRRGMMVLVGAASGAVPPVDPQTLNKKGSLFLTRPTLADHIADRTELVERGTAVLRMIAEGRLHMQIGGRYGLDAAHEAHRDLEGRRTMGKLLVQAESR
jgi:NADPH2:quinone reductase